MERARVAGVVGLLACAALVGCPPPPPTCSAGTWGDLTQPAAVSIVAIDIDGGATELSTEGATLDLLFPIQGGHVLYVGARIANMTGCRVDVTAQLEDPATGRIAAQERRGIDFTSAVGDGRGQGDFGELANTANVPACPDYLERDIVDAPWNLRLTVKDEGGRTASVVRSVTPVCRQADAALREVCRCECTKNYFLGRCAGEVDGGADGG